MGLAQVQIGVEGWAKRAKGKAKETKAKGKARPSANEAESEEQQGSEVVTSQADDVQIVEETAQVT